MRTMLGFLRKAPLLQDQVSCTVSASSNHRSAHFPFLHLCFFCTASISSSSSSEAHSFTVSHLINSCGFSYQKALTASKIMQFETPEKPDAVYAFFKGHGFSESQISKIVRKYPQILLSNPEKSLFPKLQFFYSKGASHSDIARIIVFSPGILTRSLKNQIIPSYNLLKDFFQSEEMAMTSIKRYSGVLSAYPHTYLESNIKALQELEVPRSNIASLLRNQPRAFMARPDMFRKVLDEVKEMGFHPSKINFVVALQLVRGSSKATWKRKVEAYKQWGWSEDEVRLAFFKSPACMMLSEDKIMAVMDFFVNKMGKDSSLIAPRPVLLSYSLEKRLIPRYSVVQVLLSKGLIDHDFGLSVVFRSTEKQFLHKFVNPYKEDAPQLLELYQEKVEDSKNHDSI